MKLIVDSNIVFSALLSPENKYRAFLFNKKIKFYSCHFMFVEIFKHKAKILKYSKLSEDDLLLQMEVVLSKIKFINEKIIPIKFFETAYQLCKNIDEKDTAFLALTLFLNGALLTGDQRLHQGLKKQGFNQIISIDVLK